jgi:hypothetical protein
VISGNSAARCAARDAVLRTARAAILAPMLPRAVASLAAAVLVSLAALHVYWACGGRFGADVAVPSRPQREGDEARAGRPLFRPSTAATLLVAAALAAGAAVLLARVSMLPLPLPRGLIRGATLLLGVLFVLRALGERRYVGLFKTVTETPFARWDTALFTPLCLLLGAAALWLGARD